MQVSQDIRKNQVLFSLGKLMILLAIIIVFTG
jgi:hypothetical protein